MVERWFFDQGVRGSNSTRQGVDSLTQWYSIGSLTKGPVVRIQRVRESALLLSGRALVLKPRGPLPFPRCDFHVVEQ